jgi:serine-type D-Ala-D-Ala carboxypeptidase/endopeptidase (penicillin-binding protein 4)
VRARWWVLAVLSLLTASAVVVAVSGVLEPDPPDVAPEPTLAIPDPLPVEPALEPVDLQETATLSPQVRRSVSKLLRAGELGPRVSATILSGSGDVVYQRQAQRGAAPASTLKLLTALSVLDAIPAETRIETAVVQGDKPNGIVLVGGGDATLTVERTGRGDPPAASLEQLARETAAALPSTKVHLSYNDALFKGPSVSPRWEPSYVTSGVIAPVTALMADQGLINDDSLARYPDPAFAAADEFARLLKARGVTVLGDITSARSSSAATTIASVQSAPASELVERMLRTSDNQIAESLARLAAAERQLPASFKGAVDAMGQAATASGLDVDVDSVYDASGLSRDDRVTSDTLAGVLRVAAGDPDLRPITLGLPIAGFDGTLEDRFLVAPQDQAAGLIRAKTGTLTGISAEAGMAVTCDGTALLFALVADRVPLDTEAARDVLDEVAAELVACP